MSEQEHLLVDRRTTLRWLVATMAANTMLAGCGSAEQEAAVEALAGLGVPAATDGVGYGTDPDLMNPVVPWAKTMTKQQLRLAAALSDAILPAGENSPSASQVGVQDFIDEWVSAPYEAQQGDRDVIFDGMEWLEQESRDRFSVSFADVSQAQQASILDDIAFRDRVRPGLERAAGFFARFRHLAMSAYYATEAGMTEIGYIGNTPMAGNYPGPTPEALAHLEKALERLGLA